MFKITAIVELATAYKIDGTSALVFWPIDSDQSIRRRDLR